MKTSKANILGVSINCVNIKKAVRIIMKWLDLDTRNYVCVRDVHGIMECQRDEKLKRIHNDSGLTVSDGMPIVWVGRIYGFTQIGRVYGPDLMYEICKVSIEKKYTHFLYGGKPGVADLLRINLRNKLPGVHIVGTYTPPFRPLNKYEEESLIQQVKKAKPDFFWVGLSTPKQEKFMANYISKLDTKVMLGVGAAFDIHTGLAKDAPRFIKIISLQWLYRLYQEPRRLWRRYLVNVPLFICKIALQIIGDIFKSQMKVKSK